MPISWPDEVDEVIAGDAAAAVAYLTPARGVVITPMAPLGVRDRERGTVTVTTSLGLWKKVARLRANPAAAIAYHAREHGYSDRPDFVLLQGRAKVQPEPDREWLESITPDWERFLGPRNTGLTGRLMRVYYWERVGIEIEVERVLRWRDGTCSGAPEVLGAPLPDPAPAQKPPKNGTGPRGDCEKLASAAQRLPHTLLGWSGADELPVLVAARATGARPEGVDLAVANDLVPEGGRRAGLTSHAFEPAMIGQEQRIHTGWLQRDGETITYAPHTKTGNRLPPSRLLFNLGAGIATRAGLRGARKAGVAEADPSGLSRARPSSSPARRRPRRGARDLLELVQVAVRPAPIGGAADEPVGAVVGDDRPVGLERLGDRQRTAAQGGGVVGRLQPQTHAHRRPVGMAAVRGVVRCRRQILPSRLLEGDPQGMVDAP